MFNQLFSKVLCNNLKEIATPGAPVGAKKVCLAFQYSVAIILLDQLQIENSIDDVHGLHAQVDGVDHLAVHLDSPDHPQAV